MKKLIILIAIGFFFASCEKFLDVNTSQDTPEKSSPNYLLPAVLSDMSIAVYEQGDMTAFFTQQVATTTGSTSVRDRWDFRGVTRVGSWRRNYYDVAGNANKMIEFAEAEGSQNYIGVGKIMKAMSFLMATDVFGDMPVLQIYTGIYNPTYDTQEIVYGEINRWLDEAIVALESSTPTDRKMDELSDRVYKGNVQNWLALAHAVKARYYLHLNDFANVLIEVEKAKLNWKEPAFAYLTNPENSWGKNLFGPSRPVPNWDIYANSLSTAATGTFFMKAVTAADDSSRLYALTSPGKNKKYASIHTGEGRGITSLDDYANLYDGFWTKDDSPIIYLTTEEVYFMEAEAAFQTNDKARAYTAYINGIKANFTKLGISDKVDAYLATSAVAQSSAALTLSQIMMQKYIALYLQPEAWADMRRYNYSANVYTGLQYPVNALAVYEGKWIQRLPYDPETEYKYNPKEIERLGAKEQTWIVKKIWWVENSNLGN